MAALHNSYCREGESTVTIFSLSAPRQTFFRSYQMGSTKMGERKCREDGGNGKGPVQQEGSSRDFTVIVRMSLNSKTGPESKEVEIVPGGWLCHA